MLEFPWNRNPGKVICQGLVSLILLEVGYLAGIGYLKPSLPVMIDWDDDDPVSNKLKESDDVQAEWFLESVSEDLVLFTVQDL